MGRIVGLGLGAAVRGAGRVAEGAVLGLGCLSNAAERVGSRRAMVNVAQISRSEKREWLFIAFILFLL